MKKSVVWSALLIGVAKFWTSRSPPCRHAGALCFRVMAAGTVSLALFLALQTPHEVVCPKPENMTVHALWWYILCRSRHMSVDLPTMLLGKMGSF